MNTNIFENSYVLYSLVISVSNLKKKKNGMELKKRTRKICKPDKKSSICKCKLMFFDKLLNVLNC